LAYTPPRDTCDPRYVACTEHHVACDCREAEFAEQLAEFRNRLREIEAAASRVLRGHFTHAYTKDGAIDYDWRCSCTGCAIAQLTHEVRGVIEQTREGTTDYPCLRAENKKFEDERDRNALRAYRAERDARDMECPF